MMQDLDAVHVTELPHGPDLLADLPSSLEEAVTTAAPVSDSSVPAGDVRIDVAQFASLIPFLLPSEEDILKMTASVTSFGLQEPQKSDFERRLGANPLVLGGLKTVQFRKALETVIVQFLNTPTTADGAPALKPHEALLAGVGAIAFGVALERFGLGEWLAGLIGGQGAGQGQNNVADTSAGFTAGSDLFEDISGA